MCTDLFGDTGLALDFGLVALAPAGRGFLVLLLVMLRSAFVFWSASALITARFSPVRKHARHHGS